jgi:hypothetical protein
VIRFLGIELTTYYAPVSRIIGAFVLQLQWPIENSESLHNRPGDAGVGHLGSFEILCDGSPKLVPVERT